MSNDYVWPLSDGFPLGSTATIKVVPTKDASDPILIIKFPTKFPTDGYEDIAYQATFNSAKGYLANNSFSYQKGWQSEERHSGLSIVVGKPIEITITCEITHFSLYINGNHFSDFQHRMPFEVIRCLIVVPCMKITSISIDEIKSIMWLLPNGFRTISLKGIPGLFNSSNKFDILFQTSSKCDITTEIPLSMSVLYEEGKILYAVYESNVWKKKKTQNNLFFPLRGEFEITIANKSSFFEVNANRSKFTYNVVPHDKISCLIIRGNVSVSSIMVNSQMITPRSFAP